MMPKARRPPYKAHAARASPTALSRPVTFGPDVQPPPNFALPHRGSGAPAQPGAAGGGPQPAASVVQSVSFLRLPRELRLMIYEHCGPELLPSRKWLHVRLSPAAKPGDKRWWTCDVCGREGSVCHCLRPALHAIHPALLDEVHDLVLRRNAVHPEPAAWYDLAKLHDPGRRRSMRVPGELQALWAQFMAGLRRVGVSVQWNPVYLEAVSRALSQSAPLLKELTLFMSRQQGKAAERAAYDQFLGRLSGIRSLEVIRIVGIRGGDTARLSAMAQLAGCPVKPVCHRCGEEMPLPRGPCPNDWRHIFRTSRSGSVRDLLLDDGNIVWEGELAMLGCYVKEYGGYDLSKHIP